MTFADVLKSGSAPTTKTLFEFGKLLEPIDDRALTKLAASAKKITHRFFGRTMRLFAPLYFSNECVNSCSYCGFSRDNPILRVTLTLDQVEREARFLAGLPPELWRLYGLHLFRPAPAAPRHTAWH